MLSPIEKILFAIATLVSLYFTYRGVQRIAKHIGSGQGKINWSLIWKRIGELIVKVGLFQPVFRFRFWPSLLHALIGWGFLSFLLINLADLIYAYTDFKLLESLGWFGEAYRLIADILGAAIIFGIVAMEIRRFILRPKTLSTRESTLLHPKARFGISRDSAIVALFIFTHNSMRLLGESFFVAGTGAADRWQPVISTVAGLWSGMDANALLLDQHPELIHRRVCVILDGRSDLREVAGNHRQPTAHELEELVRLPRIVVAALGLEQDDAREALAQFFEHGRVGQGAEELHIVRYPLGPDEPPGPCLDVVARVESADDPEPYFRIAVRHRHQRLKQPVETARPAHEPGPGKPRLAFG